MGALSIVVGVIALVLMLVGMALAVVPVAGTIASFAAPVVALAGIVIGGLAVSRARRDGMTTGVPMTGIVVNALLFVPAVVFALTCGMCNACLTAGTMGPGAAPPDLPSADGGPAAPPGATSPSTGPPGARPSPP
ncbi:MAG: hypothetical protein ACOCV4_08065, partial [Myxococcota bacterium]